MIIGKNHEANMDISQHLPTYPNASQQPNNAVAVVKGLKLPQFFS